MTLMVRQCRERCGKNKRRLHLLRGEVIAESNKAARK